jgi:hypothetical protein
MKVGISVRIDVTKIDKARLFKGAKGTYLDLTTFVDLDQQDQYENNGFVTQSQTKEERQAGGDKMPILGNVKVFFKDSAASPEQQYQQTGQMSKPASHPAPPVDEWTDDIPFDQPYRMIWSMV